MQTDLHQQLVDSSFQEGEQLSIDDSNRVNRLTVKGITFFITCSVVFVGLYFVTYPLLKAPSRIQQAQFNEPDLWLPCTLDGKADFPFCRTSLPRETRLKDLVSRISLDQAGAQLTARESPAIPELGLPSYYWGTNAIHGLQNLECLKSGICPTSFPAPVGLGATFDMSVVYDMARVLGDELRGYFNSYQHNSLDTWSPTININRDPRWGRNVESPGEDPLLVGMYGAAYTRGLQEGPEYPNVIKAIVTLKHWFAYSLESYNGTTRHNFDARVSAYDLGATYFIPWEYVIKEANPLGIMCSYNMVNGKPTCANPEAYRILRSWGFDGYITSDTDSCFDIYKAHKYVATGDQAVRECLRGKTDIDSGVTYKAHLRNATEYGIASKDDVERALYKAYEARFRLGLFEARNRTKSSYFSITEQVVGSKKHVEKSINAARKSMVLLKNDRNILPFSKGRKVAVIGESSNGRYDLLGNYIGPICADHTYNCVPSIYEKVKELNTGGVTILHDDINDIEGAVTAAKSADYVILTVSNAHDGGGESHDRQNISLAQNQKHLVKAVLHAKKEITLVTINGGIIALDELANLSPAILAAFMPGAHGAVAIAETIFGGNNPGGKLPITWYNSSYIDGVDFVDMSMQAGIGRTYRYYTGVPTFKFGYGLSYTRFSLAWKSRPHCSFQGSLDETCLYRIEVSNDGDLVGDEVLQAYLRPDKDSLLHLESHVPVPLKQLIFFKRITIDSGSSITVEVPLVASQFGLVDGNGDRKLQPGDYDIMFTRGYGEELTTHIKVTADVPVIIQEFKYKWW